jgi:hypothetical protein
MGYNVMEQLVDDPSDFWLFVKKYEAMLQKNLLNVVDHVKTDTPAFDSLIPSMYHKNLLMNFEVKPAKNQMVAPISYDGKDKEIDDEKVKIFHTIVRHYLDFRQKERFNKLKKLRKFQANLPIAKYEKEIVETMKNESILIIAGSTGEQYK